MQVRAVLTRPTPQGAAGGYVMAYVITDACAGVKDAACVEVCPVDAIHPTRQETAFVTATQSYIHRSGRVHRLRPLCG